MKYEKSESLNKYFKSIKGFDPLLKEEELDLARKAQGGDEVAREKLVKHNLKIVITMANKNIGRGIEVDDLIQQGNIGLFEASLRFDPNAGVRFSTFAGTRILKSMNQLIDNCGRIVRIPVNQEYDRYKKIRDGIEVDNISSVKLDDFVSGTGSDDKTTKADRLLSVVPDVYISHDMDFLNVTVTAIMSNLQDREKEIINLHYGLDGEEPMTTKEIAEEIGLTQIRVCQILSSIKKRVKEDNPKLAITI